MQGFQGFCWDLYRMQEGKGEPEDVVVELLEGIGFRRRLLVVVMGPQ